MSDRPVSAGSIGERIAKLREARGLSKSDLARLIWPDVSPPRYRTVHRWEEEDGSPERENLTRVAEVLGVSIEELLGVATGQEPPFEAWRAFLETSRGRAMTERQREALAAIWWRDSEPTVEAYAVILSGMELAKPREH
jgi:transcriptional regulator with XRE-family HTH domain